MVRRHRQSALRGRPEVNGVCMGGSHRLELKLSQGLASHQNHGTPEQAGASVHAAPYMEANDLE